MARLREDIGGDPKRNLKEARKSNIDDFEDRNLENFGSTLE